MIWSDFGDASEVKIPTLSRRTREEWGTRFKCKTQISELDVSAEGGDDYRAAVAVVAGVVDVLQAGGEVDAAPDVDGVVGLENIFAAVVEMAVAEKESDAAVGEIVLVILLDGIADEGQARTILLTVPPGAARSHALGKCLLDFSVGE